MDKLILTQIAKRWVKGYIKSSEASLSFSDSGLSEDEMQFIQDVVMKIADRITPLPECHNVNRLVSEYYDFD